VTDAEREARCAWLLYLDRMLEAAPTEERDYALVETVRSLEALPPAAESTVREEHLRWRGDVVRAAQETLQSFCPGGDPNCCDERFWPKETNDGNGT
jgi:hypothetical protein